MLPNLRYTAAYANRRTCVCVGGAGLRGVSSPGRFLVARCAAAGRLGAGSRKGLRALYAQASGAAREAFVGAILEIAAHDNVEGITLQKSKMEYSPKSHLPEPAAFEGAYFIHFRRPAARLDTISERIYLNLHPDHAAEVMRFVVSDILKADHGVQSVKVATPAGLEQRADSALIYAASLEDVDWALGRLKEYQSTHRDHFLTDLPAATRPRLVGVSTAAEPKSTLHAESFGSYLATAAARAMKRDPKPANFDEFRAIVRAILFVDGVEPEHPDRLNRRP